MPECQKRGIDALCSSDIDEPHPKRQRIDKNNHILLGLAKAELHNFGHKSFQHYQKKVIIDLLNRNNVLLIRQTGGGKSLCFQIPILVLNKLHNSNNDNIKKAIGLVICPLKSLMEDQVNKLKQNNINAEYINSALKQSEREAIQHRLKNGEIDILYCSPELLASKSNSISYSLRTYRKVTLFAVDEAHCISMWGHSFRPFYLQLANIRQTFGNPLTIACTATATQTVQTDILKQLNINTIDCKHHISSFDRPNILMQTLNVDIPAYKERFAATLVNDEIVKIVNEFHKETNGERSVMIYCGSRAATDSTMRHIAQRNRTVSVICEVIKNDKKNDVGPAAEESDDDEEENDVDPAGNINAYHAGKSDKKRKIIQQSFMNNEINTITATSAFGMGIDKANVGLVIHKTLPSTIEEYYQQIGRAGRDGQRSKAVMVNANYWLAGLGEYFVKVQNPSNVVIKAVGMAIAAQCKLHELKQISMEQLREDAGFRYSSTVTTQTISVCCRILSKYGIIKKYPAKSLPVEIIFTSPADRDKVAKMRAGRPKKLWNILQGIRSPDGSRMSVKLYFLRKRMDVSWFLHWHH